MDKYSLVDTGDYYYWRPSWKQKHRATVKYNNYYEELEVWIDGAKIGHFSTDGTYTDDVA